MRDIGERPAVDDRRIAFERLDQIGLDRFRQQHGHCAIGLQVARGDGGAGARLGDDDPPEPVLQIGHVGGEAEDRHDFRGNGNVEAVLARHPMGRSAEADDHLAQGAVVHIHDPSPHDPPRVDAELVAPVDMVVEYRRQQVMRRCDGVQVAIEVQVDVLHRQHLCPATTGSPALEAETGTQGRLAQAGNRFHTEMVQPVIQADTGCGLAFTRRGRGDGGDQH